MNSSTQTPIQQWTGVRAIAMMVACLLVGIAGGWLVRSWQTPALTGPATISAASTTASSMPASQVPDSARLKEMADTQAAPLLAQLKSDPNNSNLLTSIGNTYYDAQQFPVAIDFYQRVLKAQPSNAAVRTDMATAYWYTGDADTAIGEFNKALSYEPNNPNTLFNLGLVKWKGKHDGAGALADWQKLLASNPNYQEKDKVELMIAEVKNNSAAHPQAKTN